MTDRFDNSKRGLAPPAIALLAALPYITLQLVFISDVQGWSVALGYGLFFILFPVVLIGWAVLFIMEILKRRRLPSDRFRLPAFSLCGICFLLLFFQIGAWVQPIVLNMPSWCRVTQKIEWNTEMVNEKRGSNHRYILMLVGRGNEAHHSFTSAYLNWTGDEPAGIPNINLAEMILGHWDGYDLLTYPASLEALRSRIMNSGLPSERVNEISFEIWTIFQQATEMIPVAVSNGQVNSIWTAPFGDEDAILGGTLWMLLLLGVFQVIAIMTLPRNRAEHKPPEGRVAAQRP